MNTFKPTMPITPTPGRTGFFEITFRLATGGRNTCLLQACGFQDAKDRFDALGLGEYAHAREVSESAFQAAQGRATA